MIFSAKKDVFLEMLSSIAENVKESAHFFVDFTIRNENDLKQFAKTMKEFETKGDTFVHDIIVTLNKTFITSLEREDILALAIAMDDILDGMEQFSSRLEIYNITQIDDIMVQFSEKILASTAEVAKSTKLLDRKQLMDIRPHVIKINDIESECDTLLRDGLKNLFATEKDPIKIIQYKELYETLEGISDSCEDAADTLETIIMRNV
ncbi:DUF47 domain-containing protein [Numidum massiliense]|uniref:DUF47 domain-containing protein n=1 Tax=Numidum massiliense TaxID=1522315 RepID=UPI0006D5B0AA|nr:DUF47 domain-containing protein [Numidum massiliense]